MNGSCCCKSVVPPGHRPVQRPVDLEDPWPVTKLREPVPVADRQCHAPHRENLPRREVEDDARRGRQVGQRINPMTGHDLATEAAKAGHQRVGDRLGPADRDRPPDLVGQRAEQQAEARRRERGQLQLRVRGQAGEQGPGRCLSERDATHVVRGPGPDSAVRGQSQRRFRRQVKGREERVDEGLSQAGDPPDQPPPGTSVPAEVGCRLVDVAVQQGDRVARRPGGPAGSRGGRRSAPRDPDPARERPARRSPRGAPTSRRRGGSRGASAPRCASRRRPATRLRARGPVGRPRPVGPPRPARWGRSRRRSRHGHRSSATSPGIHRSSLPGCSVRWTTAAISADTAAGSVSSRSRAENASAARRPS